MDVQETLALAKLYQSCGTRQLALLKASELLDKHGKNILDGLADNGYAQIRSAQVALTKKGLEAGRQAARSLAVLTIFGTEILGLTNREAQLHLETILPGLTPYLLEKYCTRIGHAYTHEILAGVCCKQAKKTHAETVLPLNRLPLNTAASVVYVRTALQPSLLKLYDLGIYPGQTIRLEQLYPAYIVSTEQGKVALDSTLAKFIFVQKS